MKEMTRRGCLLLGAVAAIKAAESLAPEEQGFSGRWVADMEKSDFGSLAAPAKFVRVIDQGHLHLTIGVEAYDGQGKKHTGELRFGLDGKDSVNEVDGVEVVGFARRLGRHMFVHTNRTVDGERTSTDELWTLSDDGLTMTIEGGVRTVYGNEDISVVLQRELR